MTRRPGTTPSSRGTGHRHWVLIGFDLEQHGGHTPAGVWVQVVQRVLALTAAIWHNDRTAQPIKRSLVAYDISNPMIK